MRIAINTDSCFAFDRQLRGVLADGNHPVILPNTQAGTLERFKDFYDEVSSFEGTPKLSIREISLDSKISFYTSGSTGEPKEVLKTWRQITEEVQWIKEELLSGVDYQLVVPTVTHQHVYGFLFRYALPFLNSIETLDKAVFYPEELTQFKDKSCLLITSPAFLKRQTSINTPFNAIISSGGLLPQESAQLSFDLFGQWPLEVLGSTETGAVAVRTQKDNNQLWQKVSKASLSTSPTGELIVTSPFCANSTETMGDRVNLIDDSSFELLGRTDRIVKVEDKRVSLAEMEQLIQKLPEVSKCVLFTVSTNRQEICCVVEMTSQGQRFLENSSKLEFNNKIKKTLEPYYDRIVLPRKFRYLESIPENSQSKIDFGSLRSLF